MRKIPFFLLLICFVFFSINCQVFVKNSFNFPAGMSDAYSALVDENEKAFYFVDYQEYANSNLFKFDINTFGFINTLDLGVEKVSCGIIDKEKKVAYFGTDTNPAQIVKVNMETFEVVKNISLSQTITNLYSAQIDTQNQKAYFVSGTSSSAVAKIDLNSFTQESTLAISDSNRLGSVIDVPNAFLYVFTYSSLPKIHKIDLSTFSEVGSLSLASSETFPICGVIDSSSGYMYVGTETSPMKIVKVNLAQFTREGSITCPNNENSAYGAGIDPENHLAYFISASSLVRIDLSTFTRIDSLQFGSLSPHAMSIDLQKNSSFIAFQNSRIAEVDLKTFKTVEQEEIENYDYPQFILVDEEANMGYVGFENYGEIAKIDLTSFELIDYLSTDNQYGLLYYGEMDSQNGFAYFFVRHGLVITKVRLSDFSIAEVKQIYGVGEDNSTTGTSFDTKNNIIYVSFSESGNVSIYKFSAPGLEMLGILNLGFIATWKMFIDSLHGYLYSRLGNDPYTGITKIQLSDFTNAGSIDLSDYYIDTMALDSQHQYMYFGNEVSDSNSKEDSQWSQTCRVDLTTMSVIDCNEISGVQEFTASFVDPTRNDAFFFTNFYDSSDGDYEAAVIQIDTTSNKFLYNTSIGDYTQITIWAVDSSSQNAYFTPILENPVRFVQLSIPQQD
ncbi:protein nirf [Anaeramoeba ignava]|uniref:Protein nirf n=1 Tax=Anaeramoeba ignava TaxID=1746090 RepID=A0A9Q0L911_ANAIG|nr:protein nirf [Anaeramoeba ignava]